MLNFRNFFRHRQNGSRNGGLVFSRPLVLLQSDDWGRIGVRDRQGFELLCSSGLALGENPYDLYTLETAEDVAVLCGMLRRHRDSTGRSPCLVTNFILANLDFQKMAADDFQNIYLLPLAEGLPGAWHRPGLFEAYRQAIAEGSFYPGLHGLTHFCQASVQQILANAGARAAQLRTLWQAETPYIYWRMPWVGYEYCKPENPHKGFLNAEQHLTLVQRAAELFTTLFALPPVSACAPGYRANRDTRLAWRQCGVKVMQNGPGTSPLPYLDDQGLLTLCRSLDFEPAYAEPSLPANMRLADESFARGAPLVISVHSINFHSTVKNFRDPTVDALDRFLSALEARYPDLLYVHDGDLYDLVTNGKLMASQASVSVTVSRPAMARAREN
jgi:hypothetical protein